MPEQNYNLENRDRRAGGGLRLRLPGGIHRAGRRIVALVLLLALLGQGVSPLVTVVTAEGPTPTPTLTPRPQATPTGSPTPRPPATPTGTPVPRPSPSPTASGPVQLVPILVKFRTGASPAAIDATIRSVGGQPGRDLSQIRTRVIYVPANARDQMLAAYARQSTVERASAAVKLSRAGTPNDPGYNQQWALVKIGWEQVYGAVPITGTARIAVLDTGVDAGHPDLAGRVVAGQSFVGGDPNTDPNGHGTALAGIAAATVGNGVGIAGVAWAGASLMSVQVLGPDGTGYDSDVVAGVLWAADNGASVLLMGFSSRDYSAALADALAYAWGKGAVLVAATGNDGFAGPTYPAGMPNVIGVAATDAVDALVAGSNTSSAAVGAPGLNIYTTLPGNRYGSFGGTSAASAHVAGLAALLVALGRSNAEASTQIRGAVDSIPGQPFGRINVAKALTSQAAPLPTPTPPGPTPTPAPTPPTYAVSGNATISGVVTDTATSQPISGAVVACTGCTGSTLTVTTSITGFYSAQFNFQGDNAVLTFTASAAGYLSSTSPISVNNKDNRTLNFALTPNRADLGLTKSGPAQVVAGDTFSYTVVVTNSGPAPAQNVTITDMLTPASGLTGVSAASTAGACTVVTTPLATCAVGTLAPEARVTVTITGTVPLTTADGTVLTNTASVTSTTSDNNPTNSSATVTTTVRGRADLAVSKAATPTTVLVGQNVTYTIVVSNASTSSTGTTAKGVTVTDTVPANTTVVTATGSAGVSCSGSGPVTCTVPDLAPQAQAVITVVLNVGAGAGGQTLSNTATVTGTTFDPNLNNNLATASVSAQAAADLQLTKGATPAGTVTAGELITYTLTLTNAGPSAAQNVQLTDTLPGSVTFSSAVTPTGWTCTTPAAGAGGTITCTTSSLAANAVAQVQVVGRVDPAVPAGVTLTNTGGVTSTTFDPNLTNNGATVTTAVHAEADLSVGKTDFPDPVNAASALTYTLTVTNTGPSQASNVTVTDQLPAGVSAPGASGAGWSCVVSNGTVSCSRPSLGPGAAAQIVITLTAPTEGGLITNTAQVTSTTIDPVPDNNRASEQTTVVPQADLAVSKTDSPDPVIAGTTLTYTLRVTNNGPSTATAVTLTDQVPAQVWFRSLSGSPWTCSMPTQGSSGVITCTVSSLAPGASAAFTITVDVPADTPDGTTLTNTVRVTGATPDPKPENNAATAETGVIARTDLSVAKSGPDTAVAGTDITYTLVVSNAGPSRATGVLVTDTLPVSTTLKSASAGCGGSPAGPITCTAGILNPGGAKSFTLTVRIDPAFVGPLTNTATVAGNETDPNTSNNTAELTTQVRAEADLAVSKTDFPDPVVPGRTLTYTVIITNLGPSAAQNVTLTDSLPVSTTFGSINIPTGWTCPVPGQDVTCTTGLLMPNAPVTFTLAVTVAGNIPTGPEVILTNTATVTGATPEPSGQTGPNAASASTGIDPPPQIITFTATITPTQVNTPITAALVFTDRLGAQDAPYTATIEWGDGSISNATNITMPNTFTFTHVYTLAGVYVLTATVTDNDGQSDQKTFQYVVIYDPKGGFVTGGGWIDSPPGAYAVLTNTGGVTTYVTTTLTGKATFGFVSKYQKGANVPTGNTEFQFHAAGLNFKSTSYDWLVISGAGNSPNPNAKAQFKGTGTINGQGNYGFILTAIDGQYNGATGLDKFRIKIWDPDIICPSDDNPTCNVVYDNQRGADDPADPSTVLGGGNIAIQGTK
mgnify:CR=1 FL=1